MDTDAAIETLTALLRAEYGRILRHLDRTSPWVGQGSAGPGELAERICRHRAAASRWLGERIDALGGTVPPMRLPAEFAEISYLTLEYLLPRILRDQRAIAEAYQRARGELAGSVGEEVARLADEAADDLSRLEAISEQIAARQAE